jgi:hypothetical protein
VLCVQLRQVFQVVTLTSRFSSSVVRLGESTSGRMESLANSFFEDKRGQCTGGLLGSGPRTGDVEKFWEGHALYIHCLMAVASAPNSIAEILTEVQSEKQ